MQITNYPSFLDIKAGMSLTELISGLFGFLLAIAGLASLVMVVWGGVSYLTSAGDPSKMRDARKQIFASILGLIIVFSSWMIINTINPNLVNINEPTSTPPPIAAISKPPVIPPPQLPAGFYYIALDKIIDDMTTQEKTALLKVGQYASLAKECDHSYCEGGECNYWQPAECPPEEETPPEENTEEETPPEENWWDWFFWLPKILPIYAISTEDDGTPEDCGSWQKCSAPCNSGDPCPPDKNELIDNILLLADKTENEIAQIQRVREKISACVLNEEAVLMTCQEAIEIFQDTDWLATVQECRQAYDFYCVYGSDEDTTIDEIKIPFATVKNFISGFRTMDIAITSCTCNNCAFICECSAACSGNPCSGETYTKKNEAISAVDELETQLQNLENAVAEIAGLSAAEEITTMTCWETNSWLESINESGCPGIKIFPCCPIDAGTEETIRNCRFADFFFCSQP